MDTTRGDPRARRRRPRSSPRARAPGPARSARPKRGVGRLALETGAPVVPVAIIGTEAVRKGWRIRPHKVRIRAGAPLTFPQVAGAQPPPGRRGDRPHLALRRAAVGVAGRHRRACAAPPSSAPARGAPSLARRARPRRPRGRPRHARRRSSRRRADAACPDAVAVASPRERHRARPPRPHLPRRPAARAARGRRGARRRASPSAPACSSRSKGLVAAARHAALRLRRRAHQGARRRLPRRPRRRRRRARPRRRARRRLRRAQAFLGQIADVLRVARFDVQRTTDVTGVELAGAAAQRRRPGRRAAAPAGASAAGAAADMVLAEVDAYARRQAATPRPSPAWPAPATSAAGARRPAAARRRPARGRGRCARPSAGLADVVGRPRRARALGRRVIGARRRDAAEARLPE